VVVADVDVARTGARPAEDDPPLIVDPDAMEAGQIASQGLEPVARRRREIAQGACVVEHVELSCCDARDVGPPDSLRQSPIREEAFHEGAGEARRARTLFLREPLGLLLGQYRSTPDVGPSSGLGSRHAGGRGSTRRSHRAEVPGARLREPQRLLKGREHVATDGANRLRLERAVATRV